MSKLPAYYDDFIKEVIQGVRNEIKNLEHMLNGKVDSLQKSVNKLSNIMDGTDGNPGYLDRIRNNEKKIDNINAKFKYVYWTLLGVCLFGSFLWIKESRDAIINFIRSQF